VFLGVLCGLPLLVLAASVTSPVVSVLDSDTFKSRQTLDQSQLMAIMKLGVAGSTRRMVPFFRAIRVPPLCLQPLLLPQPGLTRVRKSILAVLNAFVLSVVIPLISADLAYAEFSGPVVAVLDGDTLNVLHNGHALPWPYVPHGLHHKPHSGLESARGKDSQAL